MTDYAGGEMNYWKVDDSNFLKTMGCASYRKERSIDDFHRRVCRRMATVVGEKIPRGGEKVWTWLSLRTLIQALSAVVDNGKLPPSPDKSPSLL